MIMSLQRWLRERRLRQHQSSSDEIKALWGIVQRDLEDAAIEQLSPDRRYATAYNAILQLATVVLHASGYRTGGESHHWVTFQALPRLMESMQSARSDYFDACRRKRNMVDYDASGEVSEAETHEIYQEAVQFRHDVLVWLGNHHPDWVPDDV
jgi:uncharacterized protein (UPF0332 family)